MTTVRFSQIDLDSVRAKLDSFGLFIHLEGSLKRYPGSIHWHLKSRCELKGVLELTVLDDGSGWISWHSNRYQEWIAESVDQIAQLVELESDSALRDC